MIGLAISFRHAARGGAACAVPASRTASRASSDVDHGFQNVSQPVTLVVDAQEAHVSAEWIAVIVAIVAVGVTVTVAIVSGFRRLDDRLRALETRVSDGETNLDAKLHALETNLDVKLRALETELDAKLHALETNFDAKLRALETSLDDRLRAVETELAYLRGLLQGAGVGPVRQPEPPAADEGAAA